MEFDNSFFEDEVREGFYIPGMIKRSWATQLDVLENVAKVCEKHGIKWFADCGTLIGAIRHHGFIPWDDDLDICMLRDDYEKFNRVAKAELPPKYRVLNFKNEKEYNNFITRVVNHDVIDTSEEAMESNHGFPYVSGIDIFPLDYLFNDENKENERRLRGKEVFEITEAFDFYVKELGPEGIIKKVENISGYRVDRSLPLLNALHRILEKIFTEADSENSEAVALMRFWIPKHNHKYPLSLYKEYINFPFENTTIRVPWAYEQVLQIEYGRWEIVNRKGGIHEYPFYSKQEEILASKRGGKVPYRYYYKPAEERQENAETKIISLLKNVHEMIGNLLNEGNYAEVLQLLENCQELAITLGTGVESKYGEESCETVNTLEEYCEEVFSLSMKIQSGDKTELVDIVKLKELLSESKQRCDRLCNSENIIFIIYNESQWKHIKDLYFRKDSESGGKAFIMVVPYYVKNNNFQKKEQRIDTIEFQDVKTLNYKTYDFGVNRPAKIYFTNPFDDYSSAEEIHPFFYSSNLRKLTDKLIYISAIDATVPIEGDEKGMLTSKYYIISPGVINADEVITFGEDIANLYRGVLEEVNDDFGIAENKISVEEKISKEIKETKETGKKTLLFYPGYSIGEYDDEVTAAKIREVTGLLSENAEKLKVIWLTNKELDLQMSCLNKKLFDEIQKIKDEFLSKNVEFRIDSDVERAINESDAFYGAAGYVMNHCTMKGIPVMVWDLKLSKAGKK